MLKHLMFFLRHYSYSTLASSRDGVLYSRTKADLRVVTFLMEKGKMDLVLHVSPCIESLYGIGEQF